MHVRALRPLRAPPFPVDEDTRQRVLDQLALLDTPPEARFDRILRIAQALFQVPIGALSLVDRNRQFFKSRFGLPVSETPRNVSFCGHAILQAQGMVVSDALRDERFVDNPLVTAAPHIRFYAGVPVNVQNQPIGTICLIDQKPRSFGPEEQALLKDLAALIEEQLAVTPIVELTRALQAEVARRTESEAAARAERARLAALLASLQAGILVEDEYRKVVLANEGLCAMFGIPVRAEALTGTDCAESARGTAGLFREPDRFLARVEGILAAREIVSGDELPLADGRVFERDYVPIWVDGKDRGHLWHYRDVTASHAVRAALEQARNAALESARVKADFLATMSHEIRTPMNGIMGLLALVEDAATAPEQLTLIRSARRAADGLLNILNDILDFSRLEAGKLSIDPQPVELAPLLDDVGCLAAVSARAKGLALTWERSEDLPRHARFDPARCRQVLTNLLGNAVKFTHRGEVTLHARLEHRSGNDTSPPDRLVFEVRDTGIGIAPEKQGIVFDKFVQADASTARSFGGSGLGLAICRQLARLMGGGLELESQLGKGSLFRFWLPFEAVTLAPAAPQALPAHADFSALRVLVVEDDPTNQLVAKGLLKRIGCGVIEVASGGQQAIDRVSESRFDLVLMDCQMPGMDGFEATRLMRASKGPEKDVPIIAMTAGAFEEDKQRCLVAGMDDFLSKPVDKRTLTDTIVRALALRSTSPKA